jgi:beta-glucosidase
LTDILFGKYSPSGHLPYSIPKAESDYPDSMRLRGFELFQVQDTFSEGLYIDYRYLNKHSIKPRYAFGHGLSYTTFSREPIAILPKGTAEFMCPEREPKGSTPVYTNQIPPASQVAWPSGFDRIWRYLYPYLDSPQSISASGKFNYPTGYQTTPQPDPPAGGDQGGNPRLWDIIYTISVGVINTGKVAGKDVVMVFVQYPDDSVWDTPVIQLRAFGKTKILTPGERDVVQLDITRKDLSIWDVKSQNWIMPINGTGSYKFWIGDSSANLTFACQSDNMGCSGGRTPPV